VHVSSAEIEAYSKVRQTQSTESSSSYEV